MHSTKSLDLTVNECVVYLCICVIYCHSEMMGEGFMYSDKVIAMAILDHREGNANQITHSSLTRAQRGRELGSSDEQILYAW